MKQDRFILGSISGMIGGLVVLLGWGLPAKLLGLTDRTFYDWGMVLILYKPKYQFLDYTVGVLAHLGISGTLGILFAGLVFLTSRRYLKLKGVLFGIIVWLSFLGLGTLYRIPMFTVVPAKSALTTWVGSGLWGLVTSTLLGIFHHKVVSNETNQEKRIRRYTFVPAPAKKQEHKERKFRFVKLKKL